MERRKVIRQGKGTLTMSLPTQWIRHVGLKQGDSLDVEEKGLSLIIGPSLGHKRGRKSHVDLTPIRTYQLVYTVVFALYTRGDEEFTFKYNKEQFPAIFKSVRQLLGFQIVEQTSNTCTVKELAHGDKENFDQVLRRIFLLLITIAEQGVDTYAAKGNASELAVQDEQVNALVLFCLRTLNKQGCADMQKAMHSYALLEYLEQLGDFYVRLFKETKHMNATTLGLAKRAAHLLRLLYESSYQFSWDRASSLREARDAFRDDVNRALLKAKHDDILALHHLRQISDLILDIAKFQLVVHLP